MSRGRYRKMCSCGPMGRECPCCFPPSGTKSRRIEIRAAERTVREMPKEWNNPSGGPEEYPAGYMQGRGAA